MATKHFCQYCNAAYTWSQERLTPGFCSTKCRGDQSALNRLPKFQDLLQHQIATRHTNQDYNSLEPIPLARDPNPVARPEHCETCGISSYCDRPIRLLLTHLDGNTMNDIASNRRYLCPNCASQAADRQNG
jgi:hypothetical protein